MIDIHITNEGTSAEITDESAVVVLAKLANAVCVLCGKMDYSVKNFCLALILAVEKEKKDGGKNEQA